MEFDFDEEKSLRFELRAADGKPAQKPGAMVVDGFVFGPFRLTLPMGSTLRFPVTWHGYGIRSGLGAALCLHSAFWEISSTDRNDYFLSATLNIPQTPREENKTWAWYGTIKIPAAKAPTKK